MKEWIRTFVAETDRYIQSSQPLHRRIQELIIEWMEVRMKNQDVAKPSVSDAFFNHVDTLRRNMYHVQERLWQDTLTRRVRAARDDVVYDASRHVLCVGWSPLETWRA